MKARSTSLPELRELVVHRSAILPHKDSYNALEALGVSLKQGLEVNDVTPLRSVGFELRSSCGEDLCVRPILTPVHQSWELLQHVYSNNNDKSCGRAQPTASTASTAMAHPTAPLAPLMRLKVGPSVSDARERSESEAQRCKNLWDIWQTCEESRDRPGQSRPSAYIFSLKEPQQWVSHSKKEKVVTACTRDLKFIKDSYSVVTLFGI